MPRIYVREIKSSKARLDTLYATLWAHTEAVDRTKEAIKEEEKELHRLQFEQRKFG